MNDEHKQNRILVPRFNEANGFITTEQRSLNMSKIRSKNTKSEIALRKVLWSLGIRYRINVKKLPGTPDIVIRKHKLVIFVDGEFWHGYNWQDRKSKLKKNTSFWIPKIERNMQRDRENNERLSQMGFRVMRFWDSEIKKNIGSIIKKIIDYIDAKENGYPI